MAVPSAGRDQTVCELGFPVEKSNDLPKKDGSLMGRPHKRQCDGNAIISQGINAIIKYSDHIIRTELPHKRLRAQVGSVMSNERTYPYHCYILGTILTVTDMLPLISHICSADTNRLHDL